MPPVSPNAKERSDALAIDFANIQVMAALIATSQTPGGDPALVRPSKNCSCLTFRGVTSQVTRQYAARTIQGAIDSI